MSGRLRGLLPAAELASLRGVMEGSFPDTAAVLRTALADNGQGGQTETTATVAAYPCSLVAGNAREQQEGGKVVAAMTWSCLLPHDADVTPKDQLEIGGLTYEVTDTDRGQSGRLCLVATLKRVE
ncbi:MAG TPA: head-tail adaptor protein [Armatimonadota bacterium]|nr:head-tail adaptor protein [Armatimonadota bacterium]